ncbi:MAG: hypothetical protein JXJ22_14200 [Bacteroidales bacterium]|nr:hypothetical protein [Bacteroidales bacterium]
MSQNLKIGILCETKTPADKRVPLVPQHIIQIQQMYPEIEIVVQKSDTRGYADSEYASLGIRLADNIDFCDVFLGVKEVDKFALLPEKTYIFFSHTTKKQPYNQELLQRLSKLNITLIDYEHITDDRGNRLIAFGYWAGLVGAYNGLIAMGLKYRSYNLKPAHGCNNLNELKEEIRKLKLPLVKILISGGGRVAGGAMEILKTAGIKQVNPEEFLTKNYNEAVFTQIEPQHYVKRKDNQPFSFQHFIQYPAEYISKFLPYTRVTDMFIACHYWDPRSPVFMTREDMTDENFKIKIIADISCDIHGPIPSTIRSSTIEKPLYGYNPISGAETEPFDEQSITVMAVDNLPGELPRDASEDFGKKVVEFIIPALLGKKEISGIEGATVLNKGKLTQKYLYLKDYLYGKE